jgi:hypothetical protein
MIRSGNTKPSAEEALGAVPPSAPLSVETEVPVAAEDLPECIDLSIEITLPYLLNLPEGEYQTSTIGRAIRLAHVAPDASTPRTVARMSVQVTGNPSEEQKQSEWTSLRKRLLPDTNRLLRIYRVVAQNPSVIELSSIQASPFRQYERPAGGDEIESTPVTVNASSPGAFQLDDVAVAQVLDRLKSDKEPGVPDLFLLDAQYSIEQGRFREAVLFAWATIDSQFNSAYDTLVRDRLKEDYSEGRKQLLGFDVSLRTKMTVLLNLVAGHSLYISGKARLWEQLSASYGKRNSIIHQGEIATQEDAERAVEVARWVIDEVDQIARPQGTADHPRDLPLE